MTVTVSDGVPDGELVTIEDASNGNAVVPTTGNTLAGGLATLTIAAGALSDGTHELFAVYGGDGTFAASQSPMVIQSVSSAPTIPTITSQPTDQSVNAGSTATFTAAASGYPTPTVHWQQSSNGGSTWSNLSGATSSTLTLADVSDSQNGDEYQAVFTNSDGSVTTSAAMLNVTLVTTTTGLVDNGPNPSSPAQSISLTVTVSGGVPVGELVTIEDASDGDAVVPTTGNTLAGDSATLTIAAGALSVGTHELFAVYGGDGTFAASQSPMLSQAVNSASTITSQPTNQSVNAGSTATFTVSASGNPTPTVQWQQSSDGGSTWANISGATSTTLTLANVSDSQNGDEYRAVFTNSAGSATTNAATLTVESAPTVTSLSPTSGPVTGGTTVTISGSNLGNATAVRFSNNGATILSDSATQIVVNDPPGAVGSVIVTVVTTAGTSATSAADQFTYQSVPAVAPPTLATIPTQTVDVGQTLQLNVSNYASDPNSPALPLTYSLVGSTPSGASIDPSTGIMTWALGANQQIGTYAITVLVSDNGSPPRTASETFNINVVDPSPVTISSAKVTTKKGFAIALTFSGPVNPATAANPNNYILTEPAKKPKSKKKPTPPPTRINLSVAYNPATNQVILKGPKTVKTSPALTLTVVGTGPSGIAKLDGLQLAGSGGLPGTNYVATVTKKAISPTAAVTGNVIAVRSGARSAEAHMHINIDRRPRSVLHNGSLAHRVELASTRPAGPIAMARILAKGRVVLGVIPASAIPGPLAQRVSPKVRLRPD